MIWVPSHHEKLYSQSNVPEAQTVFGHLALCKSHRLKLKYGEQLLPRVDDLTLLRMKHRHLGISSLSTITFCTVAASDFDTLIMKLNTITISLIPPFPSQELIYGSRPPFFQ